MAKILQFVKIIMTKIDTFLLMPWNLHWRCMCWEWWL